MIPWVTTKDENQPWLSTESTLQRGSERKLALRERGAHPASGFPGRFTDQLVHQDAEQWCEGEMFHLVQQAKEEQKSQAPLPRGRGAL